MSTVIRDTMRKAALSFTAKTGLVQVYNSGFAEEVAEAFAAECIRIATEIASKHQQVESTYAAGKKAGAFEVAEAIKEHFGVK